MIPTDTTSRSLQALRVTTDYKPRTMKSKKAQVIVGLIAALSLISGGYCFWLMTVPLSYDWVYVVVIGFIVSVIVFIIALIIFFALAIRSRSQSRGT